MLKLFVSCFGCSHSHAISFNLICNSLLKTDGGGPPRCWPSCTNTEASAIKSVVCSAFSVPSLLLLSSI